MYIKNRRNSSKFKAFGSYYTLCLTENLALRNRLPQLQRQNLFLIKFQSVFAPLSFQLVDYQ